MTKIITRYFNTAEAARRACIELVRQHRVSQRIIELYESADGLENALAKDSVDPATAAAYAEKMAGGGAVVLVRAGYKPLSVGRITREVTREMGAVDMGDLVEQVEVPDRAQPSRRLTVLTDHPHMLARPINHKVYNRNMADWPIPLISRRKPTTYSVIPKHGFMASWPIRHLVPHKVRYGKFPFGLLAPHEKRYGKFPFGLLVPHEKRYGKFPFGFLVPHEKRYGKFPFGLLAPHNKRYGRFPFDLLVPGGKRMANWPFPLLLNGKQHTNSLVPGHKYMANWPIGHLIPGHKYQAKFPFAHIIPGHKYMAKFPFAHIVPGHKHMANFPFGHIIPGHKHQADFPIGLLVPGQKYMANWIFPHTKEKAAA